MASKEDRPTIFKQKFFSSNLDNFFLNGCHIINEPCNIARMRQKQKQNKDRKEQYRFH